MIFPRHIIFVVTALSIFIALPVSAQDTRDARLEVARKYVEASANDMDMDEVVRTMYRPLLEQVRASGLTVSAEQEAQIDALYQSTMREPLEQILRAQDEVMADLFTLAEIEALYAFYQTPAGTAVMQKFPRVMEAQMPMIVETMQGKMAEIMPRLMEILE